MLFILTKNLLNNFKFLVRIFKLTYKGLTKFKFTNLLININNK